MARVDTLPQHLRPLMEGVSVRAGRCVVCGAPAPLNQHHVVRRGAGKLYKGGVEVPKPTLTLCGSGNASGCHGKAHQQRLHFRWVKQSARFNAAASYGSGHWEWLETEPMKELKAQAVESGWKPIRTDWDF